MRSAMISFIVLIALAAVGETRADGSSANVLQVPARLPKLPLIGDRIPEFEADTSQGRIRFPADYAGRWVILFSHPGDFTPVCTSEFILFASLAPDFEALGASLVGLSIESVDRHRAWKRSIAEQIEYQGLRGVEIPFPIIADEDQEIAWRLGMLHPSASTRHTVRAVFVVDPRGVLRAMTYYPDEVGRNISEIKRLLIALQTHDSQQVATGANWQPGEDVLVPSGSPEGPQPPDADCQTWYFCTRPDPGSRSLRTN